MTEETKINVSDVEQPATSGTVEISEKAKDVVSYETHKKLLGEKKRVQDELLQMKTKIEEFENETKTRQEQELTSKEEWKKLVEIRDSELTQTRTKLQDLESQFVGSRKLDAFLNSLGGKVEKKYWGLVDIDKIAIDPTTNQVDEMTVTKLVEDFRADHGRLIDTPSSQTLPVNHPKSAVSQGPASKADKLKLVGELLGQM